MLSRAALTPCLALTACFRLIFLGGLYSGLLLSLLTLDLCCLPHPGHPTSISPHIHLRSRLSQPFPRYRHHLAFCIIFRPSPSLPGIRAFLFTTLTRGAPVACNHVPLPGTILVLLLCHRAATHNRRLARTLSVNGRWMKPPSGRCRPSLVHRSSWESSFVGTRILLSG